MKYYFHKVFIRTIVDPLTSILMITSQFENQSFYNHGAPFPASKLKVGTTWKSEIAGVMTTAANNEEFTIRVRFFDTIMSTGLLNAGQAATNTPYKVSMAFTLGLAQVAGYVSVAVDGMPDKISTFNQPLNFTGTPWSVSFQWADTGNELVRFMAFTELAV